MDDGALIVRGDRDDNDITITTNDAGDLVVQGNDTSINGGTDDFVAANGTATLMGGMAVKLRQGDDRVTIDGITVAGNFWVSGHAGDDVVDVVSMNVTGNARFSLGSGADTLALADLTVSRNLYSGGHGGDDTAVWGDVSVAGRTKWGAGAGNDNLLISGNFDSQGRLSLETRNGDDFVAVAPNQAGASATFANVRLSLGNGADLLVADSQTTFTGRLVVRGGSGDDVFDNQSTETNTRTFSITTDTITDSQTRIDDIFAALTTANIDTAPFIGEAVTDPPVVTASTGDASYTENDDPITVDSGITVADDDSSDLASATVQITTGFQSGSDVLAATGQGGITVEAFNATTGTLTLTGTATVADYQAVLRSVTYENTSEDPGADDRVVTFSVTDADDNEASDTRTVSVSEVDDAATIEATAGNVSLAGNATEVTVDGQVVVADEDSENLTGAVVSISTGFVSGEDVLSATAQGGVTVGAFNATTGELTLSGTATLADYQAVLRSVTYENTNTGRDAGTRVVTFEITDEGANTASDTRTIDVSASLAEPTVTTTGSNLAYTENDGAVAVDAGVTIADDDSTQLASATVTISSGYQVGEDILAATGQNGITVGTFNTTTGTLTLTGTAAVSDYQTVLRSLTYENSLEDPTTTSREITFTVTDPDDNTGSATRTIDLSAVDDPATITTTTEALLYGSDDDALTVDEDVEVADVDNDNLTGAVISLSTGFQSGEDVLAAVGQGNITVSAFDTTTGTLTLSGAASLADYQAVLRSVTYQNTACHADRGDSNRHLHDH